LRGRDTGGDVPNIKYDLIWNCHYESPHVQQIYPN
jgi:hypothetical protein